MTNNYFGIGKIVATYGVNGEVILQHQMGGDSKKSALQGVEVIFVEQQKGSFLPYFIERIRSKAANEIYLKLEGLESKESARRLLQKQVYLDEPRFREQVREDSFLYFLGFTVEDKSAGVLGPVAEILEMPAQLLAKVYQDKRELLIPLNEATLQRIDKKKHILYVTLPEGLLDIY